MDFDRRAVLQALAASPAAFVGGTRAAEAAGVCLLSPETTAGPFWLDPGLVRRDITEGREGAALDVVLQVVDVDCRPLPGARVDVWQCDAAGSYSGFRGAPDDTRGETFLRGTQFADAEGVARFRSIWPGWYRGRTPHIHFRVFLDERTVLTSQLFFPDGASEAVFRTAPYRDRAAGQDTSNANDGIARRAGPTAYARVAEGADAWRADLLVGVAPA